MSQKPDQISVRLDKGQREDLLAACKETGFDEANVVRACVKAFIEMVQRDGEIRLPLAIVPKKSLSPKSPALSSTEGRAEHAPPSRALTPSPPPSGHGVNEEAAEYGKRRPRSKTSK